MDARSRHRKRLILLGFSVVPQEGLEPPTPSLRITGGAFRAPQIAIEMFMQIRLLTQQANNLLTVTSCSHATARAP
jgi:hypothetical protein